MLLCRSLFAGACFLKESLADECRCCEKFIHCEFCGIAGMTFGSSSQAGGTEGEVLIKCVACGEVRGFDREGFTEFAQEQFKELQSSDPGLADGILDDIAKISDRDNMPANMLPALSHKQLEDRLVGYWGKRPWIFRQNVRSAVSMSVSGLLSARYVMRFLLLRQLRMKLRRLVRNAGDFLTSIPRMYFGIQAVAW